MLIDNKNQNKKVYEWLESYTENGEMDIVTGYFTIGALSYLSTKTNEQIKKYRFIFGDILTQKELHSINLLNENLSIDSSLKLKQIAKQAVEFLKQSKVKTKILEPNFCHAKIYLYKNKDKMKSYYITGSSNLTEAGIGLKQNTQNLELNLVGSGTDANFNEIEEWFEELWNSPQAFESKTIEIKGDKKKINFKEYLISEIEKIFMEYTPKQLYFKLLFELFRNSLENDDPKFNKEIGRLENSVIYETLYPFQQKGVITLIKMLEKYDGAILADAVGLGKTWSALGVIKYYQLQGRETILLCPKKLSNNWKQYLKRRHSKFEKDNFDYVVRFHTDLYGDRLFKDGISKEFFQSDKPKLLVIDESHNLRNDKSNRYKFLIENIINKNSNLKVLLLSATPINNSLQDIRNQFNLIAKNQDNYFLDKLDIKSLKNIFKVTQEKFNNWLENDDRKISDLIENLPSEFLKLTDSLTLARTRNMIDSLKFPTKEKPQNIFITPKNIGNLKSFQELLDTLPPKLTAYKPAFYIKETETDVVKSEKLRDKALVKMIYILLAKRLESSWKSFYDTISRLSQYHNNIKKIAINYKTTKEDKDLTIDILTDELDEFAIGKREIKISEIDKNNQLDEFINDLDEDISAMDKLLEELRKFDEIISKETSSKSKDTKLQTLISIINKKQKAKNKKMIIFTAYTDTAKYIYDELEKRKIKKLALIHGDTKNYETILESFAPYTKLYKEKEWNNFSGNSYEEWQEWIKKNNPEVTSKLNNEIDILIATDVLSEGQNLQDADMVVNYDIHWNPVRVIQRMGRVDRIGSPNEKIKGVNFWPSKDINDYLQLQNRIELRMTTMKMVGSEIDVNFTKSLQKIIKDEKLENTQKNKMLEKINLSIDEIELESNSFGFSDLSLEKFREDLLKEIDNNFYKNMPNGVFSGFLKKETPQQEKELILLLKNRENNEYELVYLDENGKKIANNQKEILEFLAANQDKERFIDEQLDKGNIDYINSLQEIINKWAGKNIKSKTTDLLKKLQLGSKQAVKKVKQNKKIEKEFDIQNYDLILWYVIR